MITFLKSLINLFDYFSLDNKSKNFVFYSESKFYREHFLDLIENFLNLGEKKIILVTSDIEEFNYFRNKIKCIFIGNYFVLDIFFRTLKCQFMIMTLTDLGSHLKKSNKCKKYVYFFHALASTHQIYTDMAFREYDLVLTNGPYQTKELILAEEKFNFPKKEIINTGYFFLDYIKKRANQLIKEKNHILFAPSWNYNKNNLFDDYGMEIINKLISNNFFVTLRPHPEHFKRSKKQLEKIIKVFSNNKNFCLDRSGSNLNSLEKAALVITDNSSIIFEFLLIFKRPIINIEYTEKIHNSNSSKMNIETIEQKFKNEFSKIIKVNLIDTVPNSCTNLINNFEYDQDSKIDNFINENLSHVGSSAHYAANFLISKKNI